MASRESYEDVLKDLKEELRSLDRQDNNLDAALDAIAEEKQEVQAKREEVQLLFAALNSRAPVVSGPYTGMTLVAALKKCLRDAGEATTAKELAERLTSGGFETKAKDFQNNVTVTLNKAKDLFVKHDDGNWGLVRASRAVPLDPATFEATKTGLSS